MKKSSIYYCKTRRILLCLAFFCCCLTVSYAQKSKQTVRLSQLIGTTWVEGDDKDETEISFTKDCIIKTFIHNGKKGKTHHVKYYLSKSPLEDYEIASFDSTKVGKAKEGAYIIKKFENIIKQLDNLYITHIDYYTIEKLTENELILFHKMIPKSIGGRDISLKFTRKK